MPNKPGLLVTGASGFVGRHVVAAGHERFAIFATGRGRRPDWLPSDVLWKEVDLLDRASVATLPNDLPFVLHLASETVPSKFSNYVPLVDSVEMTLNLCRHLRAGRLLFASSCLVYASSRQPLSEESPLDPRGYYGLAKLMCETIVSRAPDIEAVIARPFNHVGAGMRPDLVIPSIISRVRKASEGDTIEMAGLDSIRDFVDVTDIVEAYFQILELPELPARVFNISSGVGTSISDIVRMIAGICGKSLGGASFADKTNSSDDSLAVVGIAHRLKMATGWTPKMSLEDSLRKIDQY